MKSLVIFESMFGGTRAVAEAVAEGLSFATQSSVVRAADVSLEQTSEADLVVVGAPTHAHGLPRVSTRRGAPSYVLRDAELRLEPDANVVPGVREWLAALGELRVPAAAFDTRAKGPAFVTGRASKAIARSLKGHHAWLIAPPESFVTTKNRLVLGELDRATAWGKSLGSRCASMPAS